MLANRSVNICIPLCISYRNKFWVLQGDTHPLRVTLSFLDICGTPVMLCIACWQIQFWVARSFIFLLKNTAGRISFSMSSRAWGYLCAATEGTCWIVAKWKAIHQGATIAWIISVRETNPTSLPCSFTQIRWMPVLTSLEMACNSVSSILMETRAGNACSQGQS